MNYQSSSDGRIPLRLVRPARPIDPHWQCQREGDCCVEPHDVVMTTMEAAQLLQRTAGTRTLHFRKTADHFVALQAHPCPLYDLDARACTVYDIRPYNCRRFACLRPTPSAEPWQQDPTTGECLNVLDRVRRSRIARRLLARIQRKAQAWAREHGWGAAWR
jgi:hypothetical protein